LVSQISKTGKIRIGDYLTAILQISFVEHFVGGKVNIKIIRFFTKMGIYYRMRLWDRRSWAKAILPDEQTT